MRGYRPGQVIDGFTLEEPLHRGGMATLWAVTHPDHALPLVMKVPIMDPDEGPGAIVGFEVEQMILPRLFGRHVPRFIASSFSHDAYIVMERIDGTSLVELGERAPLPIDDVVSIGARVAAAIHDVHGQLVIHHDVKPANVLLRATGEAVLVDFGLAWHEQLPDLVAEEFRLPVGTVVYISPEELLRDRSDPRSDLFALGVVLYELTTGVRPFGNPSGMRALRRRLWRDPIPPRVLRPESPPWLQEVILRCLEVDPRERHQTGAQLAFDLSHPQTVHLTARAERCRRDSFLVRARRRLSAGAMRTTPSQSVAGRLASAPLVMVAVDLAPEMDELAQAIRVTVRRMLEIEPGARLVCVNILKTARLAINILEDGQGRNLHVQRLLELKHWAQPLDIATERLTHHVLEAPDIAQALIEYARANQVDHIVVGARGSSTMRRYLGSVSSRLVAESPCSVTVIRARALNDVFAEAPPDRDDVPDHGSLHGTDPGESLAGAPHDLTALPT
jgi:nucleotide-binding universal stress UspA family protein